MRQIQVADLTASANEIDTRMGPIPGRSSDRIANELRWAADELQRAMDMLGDVPGRTLTERLQTYIGRYTALQSKGTPHAADQAVTAVVALAKRLTMADVIDAIEPFAKVGLDVLQNRPGWANWAFRSKWADRYTITYPQFEKIAAVGVALRQASEESCPGHVAWSIDPKICANCGVHIDSLRPPEDDEGSR